MPSGLELVGLVCLGVLGGLVIGVIGCFLWFISAFSDWGP